VLSADALKAVASHVAGLAQDVADARNEVTNLSRASGISTETLSGLRLAAEGTGRDLGALEGALSELPKKMAETARGGGEAKAGFDALGVSVTDAQGNLRSTDDVFRDTVESLQGVEDGTLRSAIASTIFGDSASVLGVAVGDVPLDHFVDQARLLGYDAGPAAAASAREWQRNTAELGAALKGTTADLVDMLGINDTIASFTLGFVYMKTAVVETLKDTAKHFGLFADGLKAALSLDFDGARQSFQALAMSANDNKDAAMEAAAAFYANHTAIKEAGGAVDDYTGATNDASGALKGFTKNQQQANEAAKEGEKALKATNDLYDIQDEAREDTLTDEQKIAVELARQLETIRQLAETSGDHAAAESARRDVEARAMRDIVDVRAKHDEEQAEKKAEAFERELEYQAMLEEGEVALHEARLERGEQFLNATTKVYDAAAGAASDFLQMQLESQSEFARMAAESVSTLEQKREELSTAIQEATTAEEKRALESDLARVDSALERNELILDNEKGQIARLFRAQQAVQISSAIISGASAAIAALAPPPMGLGPIAGPALATAVGITTAAQVATIAAQQPPQFDAGFAGFTQGPDNFPAILRQGEGVTNQRATDALGGPRGVDELNRTGSLPAQGGQMGPPLGRSEFHRLLGQVVAEELGAGRELTRAMRRGKPRAGVRPVYQSR
jgi:hypothetical protein